MERQTETQKPGGDYENSNGNRGPGNRRRVAGYLDELMIYDTSSAAEDFDKRQDWQDFWRVNYSR